MKFTAREIDHMNSTGGEMGYPIEETEIHRPAHEDMDGEDFIFPTDRDRERRKTALDFMTIYASNAPTQDVDSDWLFLISQDPTGGTLKNMLILFGSLDNIAAHCGTNLNFLIHSIKFKQLITF